MADKQTYANRIAKILRGKQDRHGFLDYWSSGEVAHDMFLLLKRADAFLEQKRPAQAIPICQAVIEGIVPAVEHADDSGGGLGESIAYAVDTLQRASELISPPERAELFDYCVALAPQEPYCDWDWGWDLAALAAGLLDSPQDRAKLFGALDRMAGSRADAEWADTFNPEQAALIKLSVMKRVDDDTAVQAFLEEHIAYERLREALARFHLERGDLDSARRICNEWLEQPQKDKPGLRGLFWAVLLDVAAAAADLDEQIGLCEVLFQDRGDFIYLERLKDLVGAEAWPAYRAGLVGRAIERRSSWVDLGALYVREEMWADLLAFVQSNPHRARSYDVHLAARYPGALALVYEQLALKTVAQKVNRKGYREACRYIQTMIKLGQEERAAELIARWRVEYKQRPALIDELDRSFGPQP